MFSIRGNAVEPSNEPEIVPEPINFPWNEISANKRCCLEAWWYLKATLRAPSTASAPELQKKLLFKSPGKSVATFLLNPARYLEKMILLQVKQEENINKIMHRKKGRSLPDGLTGNIDAGSVLIECPDQDGKYIDYNMCFDYSGSHEKCRNCKHNC